MVERRYFGDVGLQPSVTSPRIVVFTADVAIPAEGDTLGAWAGIILDRADGGGLARCQPSGGSAALLA